MWWIAALIRKILASFCEISRTCADDYRLSRRKQIIEEYFETSPWDEDWIPRYNIAPTQPVPVIRQHPKEPVRQISLMKWGLVPKDMSGAARMINARSETAHALPAFRETMKLLRCLVPADGFYHSMLTKTLGGETHS